MSRFLRPGFCVGDQETVRRWRTPSGLRFPQGFESARIDTDNEKGSPRRAFFVSDESLESVFETVGEKRGIVDGIAGIAKAIAIAIELRGIGIGWAVVIYRADAVAIRIESGIAVTVSVQRDHKSIVIRTTNRERDLCATGTVWSRVGRRSL